MKRHPSLEAFSRDHNVGLILGRRLVQAADADDAGREKAARELVEYWDEELREHFAVEERLLTHLIPDWDMRTRLRGEHLELAERVARLENGETAPESLRQLGTGLGDHIRWEERVLFPAIEEALTEEQLRALGELTDRLEQERANSRWAPRRGELMQRRNSGRANPQAP